MDARHLDDGAYVSDDGRNDCGVAITADHHDPAVASNVVWLSERAIRELIKWFEERAKNTPTGGQLPEGKNAL